MNSELNLLPSQAKFQAKIINLKKKVTTFLWGVTGFWLLVLGVTFAVWLFFRLNLNREKDNYTKTLAQYKSLSDNAFVSEKLKYRAKLVAKMLDERFEYGESIKKAQSFFSEKIKVEGFELLNVGDFEISGVVAGVEGIDEVEEKIEKIAEGRLEGFAFAKMKSLSFANNAWEFNMELKLE
ncbi:hypothetical protein KJ909_02030 [Patescibacteria group bacterium]|nr:hypothetical protein [Patescibacteria group bacterium]